MIRLEVEKECVALYKNKTFIGRLVYFLALQGNKEKPIRLLIREHASVVVEFKNASIEDHILQREEIIIVQRRWMLYKKGKWTLSFSFIPSGNAATLKAEIPGVLEADSVENLIRMGPFSEFQPAIPSVMTFFKKEKFVLLFSSPSFKNPCPAKMRFLKTKERNFQGEISKELMTRADTLTESHRFFIYHGSELNHRVFIFKRAVESYNDFHPHIKSASETSDWNSLLLEKLDFFLKRVVYRPWLDKTSVEDRIGWYPKHPFRNMPGTTGLLRNLYAARVLLFYGMLLDMPIWLHWAWKLTSTFLSDFSTDGVLNIIENSERRAYTHAEAAAMLLSLYHSFKSFHRERPQLIRVAEKTIELFVSKQAKTGSFSDFGQKVKRKDMTSVALLSSLVALERSGINRFSEARKKAAGYYLAFINRGVFKSANAFGKTHERESSLALLKAFLDLYVLEKSVFYLQAARQIASYLLRLIRFFDLPRDKKRTFPEVTGLTRLAGPVALMDFKGIEIAYEYLRLFEMTGEEFWKNIAEMILDGAAAWQCVFQRKKQAGLLKYEKGYKPDYVWKKTGRRLFGKPCFSGSGLNTAIIELDALARISKSFPHVLLIDMHANDLSFAHLLDLGNLKK